MKFLCIIVLFVYSNILHGQNKFDLSYFALGLVDDYWGRTLVRSDKLEVTKLDEFHESEIDLMDFLDSLIDEENKAGNRNDWIAKKRVRQSETKCVNCSEFFNYYSKRLADEINQRYNFKFDHSWDEKNRKVYRGRIKTRLIKSEIQHISFLSGAFVRFGTFDNDIFIFSIANSYYHFKAILRSLKSLNCEIISVKTMDGTPTNRRILFRPSGKLKPEIVKYLGLKRKLESKANYFYKVD